MFFVKEKSNFDILQKKQTRSTRKRPKKPRHRHGEENAGRVCETRALKVREEAEQVFLLVYGFVLRECGHPQTRP